MTQVGIYSKIWPEPLGLPSGGVLENSLGLEPYFTVYPDLSHNTDTVLPSGILENILLGKYWKI